MHSRTVITSQFALCNLFTCKASAGSQVAPLELDTVFLACSSAEPQSACFTKPSLQLTDACKHEQVKAGKWEGGHNKKATQYFDVITELVGFWPGRFVLLITIISLCSTGIAQVIACSTGAYYLNTSISKRYPFIMLALPSIAMHVLFKTYLCCCQNLGKLPWLTSGGKCGSKERLTTSFACACKLIVRRGLQDMGAHFWWRTQRDHDLYSYLPPF